MAFGEMCTKQQWIEKLPKIMQECRDIEFRSLKIQVSGNTARADCLAATPKWALDENFDLVKENGRWVMKGWTYTQRY
jgi:hypothetical protein